MELNTATTTLLDSNTGPVYITPHKSRKRKKTSHRIFQHMYRVLNEVYLQKILDGWTINRETNLMSLLNL